MGGPSWSARGIRATTLSLSNISTPSDLLSFSILLAVLTVSPITVIWHAAEDHRAEVNSDADAQGNVELALERWAASLYRFQHSERGAHGVPAWWAVKSQLLSPTLGWCNVRQATTGGIMDKLYMDAPAVTPAIMRLLQPVQR
jgi:hypothetical protein